MSLENNGIEKLKKMDKKEISNFTHISIRSLENIVNKNFEELHITKTLGFIRILEKTYGLDLSEWLTEFKAYKEEHPPKESEGFNIIEDRKSKMPLIFAFIILVFVIAYFVIPFSSENKVENETSNKIISEIKDNLEDAKKIEQSKKEIIVEEQKSTTDIQEELPKEEIVNQPQTTIEEDKTEISSTVNKQEVLQEASADEPLEEIELYSKKIIIKPRGKVWIGLINTKNNTRKQLTIEKEGELEVSDGMLIMTGHSYFTIINEGVNFEFKDMSPAYFYVQGSFLNKISKTNFKKLNKDSLW